MGNMVNGIDKKIAEFQFANNSLSGDGMNG
jgi:hypothetical protein